MNLPAVSTSPVRNQVTIAPVKVAMILQTNVLANNLRCVYMCMTATVGTSHMHFASVFFVKRGL